MGSQVFKKTFFSSFISVLVSIIFTLVIVTMVWVGLRQAEQASRAEGLRLLEEAIMRVVVHSYAVNGYFPESLDYIIANYGIYIDTSRFVVHYDIFASNLLPDVRVFFIS